MNNWYLVQKRYPFRCQIKNRRYLAIKARSESLSNVLLSSWSYHFVDRSLYNKYSYFPPYITFKCDELNIRVYPIFPRDIFEKQLKRFNCDVPLLEILLIGRASFLSDVNVHIFQIHVLLICAIVKCLSNFPLIKESGWIYLSNG